MVITRVPVAEIFDLRHRVLRAHLGRESAHFEGDDAADTVHFAASNAVGEVVGCVSLMRQPREEDAWQLRGMAVDESQRGTGVGRTLLQAAEQHAGDAGVWCNARLGAADFYARHGWVRTSDPFDVPTAGPHVRMRKPR